MNNELELHNNNINNYNLCAKHIDRVCIFFFFTGILIVIRIIHCKYILLYINFFENSYYNVAT